MKVYTSCWKELKSKWPLYLAVTASAFTYIFGLQTPTMAQKEQNFAEQSTGTPAERTWQNLPPNVAAVSSPQGGIQYPVGVESPEKLEYLKSQSLAPAARDTGLSSLPKYAVQDSLLSSWGGPLAPILVSGFEAVDNSVNPGSNNGYYFMPPDPVIAVGQNHVAVVVNSIFAIYNKSGTLVQTTGLKAWFSDVYTGGTYPFDPRIAYDHNEGRWIMMALVKDSTSIESWYLLSVSRTSDPTGAWWNYKLQGKLNYSGTDTWADYPDLGFDGISSGASPSGAVYITSNQFTFANLFKTAALLILPKSRLYAGQLLVENTDYWRAWDRTNADATQVTTLRAATTFGEPGGQFLVNNKELGGNIVTLWKVIPTYPPTPVNWTRQASISIRSHSVPPNAPQLGGSALLDTNSNRMYNAVYRNGYLYAAFTEGTNWGSGTVAAIRYLKLDTSSNNATLDVTYGLDGYYYWFPAISADSSDNIAMVFARSSPAEYAGIRYTGRMTTDSATQDSAQLKAGEKYIPLYSGSKVRWGDYFGIANDPADGNKVWVFGEWAKDAPGIATEWDWGTWVGQMANSSDTSPPGPVGNLNSPTHTTAAWSKVNIVTVAWTASVDTGGSGLAGYVSSWDQNPATLATGPNNLGNTATSTFSPALSSANNWYFHIRPVDNASNYATPSHLGPFYIDTIAPGPVSSLSGTGITTAAWSNMSSITITWATAADAHSGLDGYSLIADTSPSTIPDTIKDMAGTINSVTLPTAEGNSWYFHIRPGDIAGNWATASHLGPFWFDLTQPAAVSGLTSTTHATSAWSKVNIVTVAWTASVDTGGSGLAGYVSSWDQNPATLATGPNNLANTATSTFSSALSPANNWYFHIRPVDNAGNYATATHLGPFWVDAVPPSVPSLVSPSPGAKLATSTFTFSWGAVSDVSGVNYRIQVATVPAFSTTFIDQGNLATAAYATSPFAQGFYYWRVKATDGAGNDSAFASASFTIDTTAPGIPALLSPANAASLFYLPTLDWSDVADLSGVSYNLQVDSNSNFSSSLLDISGIATSIYTVSSNLTATIPYFWRVRAIDGAGNIGGFSASSSFTLNKTTATTTLLAGWNMFSSPVSPDPATASYQIADDISPVHFFSYNSTSGVYDLLEASSLVNIGKGYWIKVASSSVAFDLEGIPAGVSGAFIVSLTGGNWNQIGYPFNAPQALGNVHVLYQGQEVALSTAHTNGWVTKYFYEYDPAGGVYITIDPGLGDQLKTFKGYWVKAQVPAQLIIPPP